MGLSAPIDAAAAPAAAILRDTPKSVTELRADLPKEFARLIRQCLQKDPKARLRDIGEVRDAPHLAGQPEQYRLRRDVTYPTRAGNRATPCFINPA